MAITRVQQKNGSTGGFGTSTSWTIALDSNPTAGNCLFLYLTSKVALSITSVVQSGSSASWTLLTSATTTNRFIYVYGLVNVPSGSTSTITLTLSSAANNFCSIIEEISGLATASVLDKTSTANGAATNTYTTGSTATTSTASEYWVNIYAYYNGSDVNLDATAASPTNGYTVFGALNTSPNPVKSGDSGWTGTGIRPSPLDTFGMFIAYQIASTASTAGGNVTDNNSRSNDYIGLAITLLSTSSAVTARRRVISSFM